MYCNTKLVFVSHLTLDHSGACSIEMIEMNHFVCETNNHFTC